MMTHRPIVSEHFNALPNTFNPGLVEHEGLVRLSLRTEHGNDRVENYLCEFDERTATCGEPRRIQFPSGFRREDVRLFVYRGQLHAAYSIYRQSVVPKQRYCRLHLDGTTGGEHQVEYNKGWPEKNLMFFEHEHQLYLIHSSQPNHVVLRVEQDRITDILSTPSAMQWPFGEVRGGAPPVRLPDGTFLHVFHSSMWCGNRRVYFVGAYVFAAHPPFQILKATTSPLLMPGPKAHLLHRVGEHWQRFHRVVFPGGAIVRGNELLIAYGHNDLEMCLARLSLAEVLAEMD